MSKSGEEAWKSVSPKEYFSRKTDKKSAEYPSDIGPEVWLLKQVEKIGDDRAEELLIIYGIVANIPTEKHQREAIKQIEGMGEVTAERLQERLGQWEQAGVLGGMDYNSDGKPYTIFFPEELEEM